MAAAVSSAYAPRRPAVPLALLALLAAVLLAVATRQAVPVPVAVQVEYTAHVFRSRSWRTPLRFFRTCRLPGGEYGLQIVNWSWRALAWKEITSFIPKNGTAAELYEYLSAIGERVF